VTVPGEKPKKVNSRLNSKAVTNNAVLSCLMCSKPIDCEPHIEVLKGKKCTVGSKECARTYKKLKNLYGEHFE